MKNYNDKTNRAEIKAKKYKNTETNQSEAFISTKSTDPTFSISSSSYFIHAAVNHNMSTKRLRVKMQ